MTHIPLTPDLVNFDTSAPPVICSLVIFLDHFDPSELRVTSSEFILMNNNQLIY